MKISIKHYNNKVTWDNNKPIDLDDTNLEESFDAFVGLLVASGFSEEGIKNFIVEWGQEIEIIRNNQANESN